MQKDTRPEKPCTKCGVVKPRSEFYSKGANRGLRADCKPCHRASRQRWADSNRDVLRQWYYGISPIEYARLLDAQGHACAICREPESSICGKSGNPYPLAVDHDHSCCPGRKSCGRCVRGLLCGRCNRALGLLRDDAGLADVAAAYLRKGSLS